MSNPIRPRIWIHFLPVVFLAFLPDLGGEERERIPGARWQRLEDPRALGWSLEGLRKAREFSETLDTAAVMIVEGGLVVDAWGPTALPLRCHSIRKSILSALYGPHVARGTIELDHTLGELGIDDREPSLTDEEREATVRDLLRARSGIYHPALYETAAMAAARPARGSHPPGTFWYYNNWDFNALGSIFEQQTARSLFEEFEDRLAGPLGMQDFRRSRDTRYVTGKDSVHPAYPFLLSTRDLARFGLLFLRGGRWGDLQVLPEAWVTESTTSYSETGSSGGYGYMWWVAVEGRHFPRVKLPRGSYSARGYRGQYLVVIPAYDLVVCHRVNTFQEGTRVSRAQFGMLLGAILAARGEREESGTPVGAASPSEFDLLLRGGEVIDGTGGPRFKADVAIRDDRIVRIGELEDATAAHVIDARGLLVAPGFIDLHSHAEEGLVAADPARRSAPNLITQGITTAVIHQDGGGPLDLRAQVRRMREGGIGLNAIPLVGHGTVRGHVMGDDHRRPANDVEVRRMQELVAEGLEAGAFGLSSGLEYIPGRWSTPEELEALAREVAKRGGVYIAHERSSGSEPMWYLPSRDPPGQPSMLDNLGELIELATRTGVTTVATHIKARGVDFWGSSERMNELIRRAREKGVPIFADQYPYNTSGSDGRIILIPVWATREAGEGDPDGPPLDFGLRLQATLAREADREKLRRDIEHEIARRGGPEHIVILEHPDPERVGRTLAEHARKLEGSPFDAAIDLQLNGDRSRRGGARLRAFSMSEKDVENFARTSWTATSSDAGIALPGDGPVHPRFYGAFPRKIRRYAIERGLFTVEEAVRVSTSLPAGILSLKGRGVIGPGAVADLVVFDEEEIRDTATVFEPHRQAEGIVHVLVNGQLAVEDGRWLGALPGRVILREPGAARQPGTGQTEER